MSVYVDSIREYPREMIKSRARHVGTKWCHMWADNVEELHNMAARIGMKRTWFQDKKNHKHYDLVPSKRALAVKYGAVAISYAEGYRKNRIQ